MGMLEFALIRVNSKLLHLLTWRSFPASIVLFLSWSAFLISHVPVGFVHATLLLIINSTFRRPLALHRVDARYPTETALTCTIRYLRGSLFTLDFRLFPSRGV